MTTHRVCIVLTVETDDERLNPENISTETVKQTAAIRKAVIDNLPKLSRVVAVMPEELGMLMMYAHTVASAATDTDVLFPPSDYIPPTRD